MSARLRSKSGHMIWLSRKASTRGLRHNVSAERVRRPMRQSECYERSRRGRTGRSTLSGVGKAARRWRVRPTGASRIQPDGPARDGEGRAVAQRGRDADKSPNRNVCGARRQPHRSKVLNGELQPFGSRVGTTGRCHAKSSPILESDTSSRSQGASLRLGSRRTSCG
jgi:hypothetical protein